MTNVVANRIRFGALLVLGPFFLASLALNLVQRSAIKALESSLSAASRSGAAELLTEGVQLPPLKAADLSGRQKIVGSNGSTDYVVLYVFQPSCIWCLRNRDLINTLATHADHRFQFVGVAANPRGEVAAYLKDHSLSFPVVADVEDASVKDYKLGITPQMIVLGREGKVVKLWSGAFIGGIKNEVEKYFGVQLPGLHWEAGRG